MAGPQPVPLQPLPLRPPSPGAAPPDGQQRRRSTDDDLRGRRPPLRSSRPIHLTPVCCLVSSAACCQLCLSSHSVCGCELWTAIRPVVQLRIASDTWDMHTLSVCMFLHQAIARRMSMDAGGAAAVAAASAPQVTVVFGEPIGAPTEDSLAGFGGPLAGVPAGPGYSGMSTGRLIAGSPQAASAAAQSLFAAAAAAAAPRQSSARAPSFGSVPPPLRRSLDTVKEMVASKTGCSANGSSQRYSLDSLSTRSQVSPGVPSAQQTDVLRLACQDTLLRLRTWHMCPRARVGILRQRSQLCQPGTDLLLQVLRTYQEAEAEAGLGDAEVETWVVMQYCSSDLKVQDL